MIVVGQRVAGLLENGLGALDQLSVFAAIFGVLKQDVTEPTVDEQKLNLDLGVFEESPHQRPVATDIELARRKLLEQDPRRRTGFLLRAL